MSNSELSQLEGGEPKAKVRSGFALIMSLLTILLMVALVTGLLLFVRSQQRMAEPALAQLRAEANTHLAASLAMGQLQKSLGPDMRATAYAESQAVARGSGNIATGVDAFNPNRRRVLMVLDTSYPHQEIPYPVIGRKDDSGFGPYAYQSGLIDRRYSNFSLFNHSDYESNFSMSQFNWMLNFADEATNFAADARPSLLRSYLASGVDFDPTADSTPKSMVLSRYDYPDPLSPETMIRDAGTEANLVDGTDVDLRGSFAYLIEDSSLKASLRATSSPNLSGMNYSQEDWDWAQKLISQNASIAAHPDLPQDADSLWTALAGQTPTSAQEAVSLFRIGTQEQWLNAESGYSFTPNYRVMSNSRIGGLQGDLSAYLAASDTSLAGSAFANTKVQKRDAGNASLISNAQQIAPIMPGRFHDEIGPSFEAFRQHARLKDQVSNGKINGQFYNELMHTDKLGGVWASSWQSMFTAHQGSPVDNASSAGGAHAQRLHPVMIESSLWFVPTVENEGTAENPSYRILTHFHPKVVLWNPYSVDIPAKGYVVALPLLFRHEDNPDDFSGVNGPYRFRFHFKRKGSAPSSEPTGVEGEEDYLAAGSFRVPLSAKQLVPSHGEEPDADELDNFFNGNPLLTKSITGHHVPNGQKDSAGQGPLHGERYASRDIDGDGKYIHRDFVLFYLEPTEIKAGECLVFVAEPAARGNVGSGNAGGGEDGFLVADADANGEHIAAVYRTDDISKNILSARFRPNGSSYYIPSSVVLEGSYFVEPKQANQKDEKGKEIKDENGNTIPDFDEDGNPVLADEVAYDEMGHVIPVGEDNPLFNDNNEIYKIDFADYQIKDVSMEATGAARRLRSGKGLDSLFFAVKDSSASSSPSIPEQDVFIPSRTAESYPLIQRIATSHGGSGDSWGREDFSPTPLARRKQYISDDYDGDGVNELGSYLDIGNNPPPARWGISARLRNLDDQNNYEDNFGQSLDTPDYFLRHDLLAQFNFRSLAQFNTAADMFLATSHSSHTIGAWYVPRAEPDLFDNSITGFYRSYPSGHTHGSPFMYDGVSEDIARPYVYFDVPSEGWNPLSLGQFRHAQFSSTHWSASYPLGHGKADFRTAVDATTHALLTETSPHWQWGIGPGENKSAKVKEGGSIQHFYLQDLVDYDSWSGYSSDYTHSLTPIQSSDQSFYDLGYSLNHYLLDDYFFSTLDYSSDNSFAWDWASAPLNNRIVPFNLSSEEKAEIEDSGHQLAASGVLLEGAFNPNSTDVNAWSAFLASLRGKTRETLNAQVAGNPDKTLFARIQRPVTASTGEAFDYFDAIAHSGAIALTDLQIRKLAEKIVEVNLERGPALTLADFVSRPLTNQKQDLAYSDSGEVIVQGALKRTVQEKSNNDWDSSKIDFFAEQIPVARRSRLEEAILRSGINSPLHGLDTLHTMPAQVDRRKPAKLIPEDGSMRNFRDGFRAYDNEITASNYKISRDLLPESELLDEWVTWGLASYLTQQDLLEPLLPAMSTRGDTFVVRCYGSSENAGEGARRFLELTLQRTPEFLHHQSRNAVSAGFGNSPQDAVLIENQQNASLSLNPDLNNANYRFGRRFQIVSQRWITEEDL